MVYGRIYCNVARKHRTADSVLYFVITVLYVPVCMDHRAKYSAAFAVRCLRRTLAWQAGQLSVPGGITRPHMAQLYTDTEAFIAE